MRIFNWIVLFMLGMVAGALISQSLNDRRIASGDLNHDATVDVSDFSLWLSLDEKIKAELRDK